METIDQAETAARQALCDQVREMIRRGDYDACEKTIRGAMGLFPHAPEPHNLLGILLETRGNQQQALKHYRAAWALDPTYRPVRRNLDNYTMSFQRNAVAYDEADCGSEPAPMKLEIVYDQFGAGHVSRHQG